MGEVNGLILEVKKKKEFSELPDAIVERALFSSKNNIKETRSLLRKYFGVFMTNKVIKGKNEEILKSHISSKKRDYQILYLKICEIVGGKIESIIDLGCGANGFSYPFLLDKFGEINYLGVEATGQITKSTNNFFKSKNFTSAKLICEDIFDLENIKKIANSTKSPKIIFIFQVIDALESAERNFSKKLLLEIKENVGSHDFIIISNSLKSISGRKEFYSNRDWLKNFLRENFLVIETFNLFDEEFLVVKKK